MKEGWEIKKLGDILEVLRNGVNCKQDKKGFGDKISRIETISNGEFDLEKVGFASLTYAEKERYKLHKGDVLFSHINSPIHVGKTALFNSNEEIYHGVNLLLMRPKSFLNNTYFAYYLNFLFQNGYWKGICKQSVNQASVNQQDINKVKVNYPKSLTEQQRIVSILDECFAAIDKAKANAEQNLKNAKELFESYLQGVFEKKGDGWEHTRLGDICQINDGTHFSPKNNSEGDYMYVTAKNIKPYYIDLSNISYVTEKDHREIYSRCSPKKGDVLYIKDGATAGIAAINTIEGEFSMLSSVALLKCSERVLNIFLVHYMNSKVGKKNFLGYLDGAAITRLTLVKIKNVCFPLPPLQEQQSIVNQLDTLRAETQKLEAVYQKKIADLEELKKSILQKAFAGELNTEKVEIL